MSCDSADERYRGTFTGMMNAISKERPQTTLFADAQEATDFVFALDGSCGYHFRRDLLSFQEIEHPPWDISFCHDYSYDFPLLDELFSTYDLHADLDCVLYMHDVPQVWKAARLYNNAPARARR